jgi:hypothetical protein
MVIEILPAELVAVRGRRRQRAARRIEDFDPFASADGPDPRDCNRH